MSLYSVAIALAALLPSAGVAFLFYVVIKAMLEGDRNERLAHSKWEADHKPDHSPDTQTNNVGAGDSVS